MSLENKIKLKVTEQELQTEIQKQLRMMPGQEKDGNGFLSKKPFCGCKS